METYGANVDDTHIALTILANIEIAVSEDYGLEFRPALHAIKKTYVYNPVHDNTSVAMILKDLTNPDTVRCLKNAPTASNFGPRGNAKSVANSVSYLQSLMIQPKRQTSTQITYTQARKLADALR